MFASASFEGSGSFTFNGLLRRPNLNRLGGEWKTFASVGSIDHVFTDFYQPLSYSGRFFTSASYFFSRDGEDAAFVNDQQFLVKARNQELGLDLGFKLANLGELRLGATTGSAELDPRSGPISKVNDDTGAWRLLFLLDGMDNANFPRSGSTAIVEWILSRESLGADEEFDRLFVTLGHAWRAGDDWTFAAFANYGTDLGSSLPVYSNFRSGGFLSLSGLQLNELAGSRLATAAFIPYRKVGSLPSLFGGDLYMGGSLEAGNVWTENEQSDADFDDLRASGSLWAGVDTIFGPLYLGWGLSEGGNTSWYLFLGRLIGANRTSVSPRFGH